jgi:DNA polymerase-3 subunit epsilon
MSARYVICDIEATGLHEAKEPIEVALITLEEDRVVDVYETLIDPLLPISEYIQDLTTITPRDLFNAPKFYDVAEAIRLRLEGAIFVSHNTDFDLELLKKKYREMGQELKVKSFCTLRVAQEEIPGLKNYNLDALCSFFNIKIKGRHRAIGDAWATVELFKELRELRLKVRPTVRFLPHHERDIRELPARAGLLTFKDEKGKVIRHETALDMARAARDFLEVKRENRELLEQTETVQGETTGLALIAEFRKLLFHPFRAYWMITVEERSKEKYFKVLPYRKGLFGVWYFAHLHEAKRSLRALSAKLKGDSFAYREGGKSKEEILKHNQLVDQLVRDMKFPADHLLLMGEGRTLGEKSIVLVRDQHVVGYGYSAGPEESILADPERFLIRRFSRHIGADRVAQRYLKELKHRRVKNEGWRALSDHAKLSLRYGDTHGPQEI